MRLPHSNAFSGAFVRFSAGSFDGHIPKLKDFFIFIRVMRRLSPAKNWG